MSLVSIQNLTIAFGGRPLLDDATLQVHRGDRVGLVGRNGEGKSTLLGILAGAIAPDRGAVVLESGARIALLPQEVPVGLPGTVEEVIETGVPDHAGDHHAVQRQLSRMGLEADARFETLSGGQKRRALLGRALAGEPDVLLLDEPTNHLDLEGIEWLEGFLRRFEGTLLFVTHDRTFLQALATRIVELDRGRLTSWACSYRDYLERKDELLRAEEKQWAEFDRKLSEEEAWIRRGIKARRTGTITRGDKIGIIGPNVVGKTTLIKLLRGRIQPDHGTVEHGTSLEVQYFDQHREQLDEAETVVEAVAGGSDHVLLDGEPRHVMGCLRDFLFSPARARQPVRSLSGGERNRPLFARLSTGRANVLVLDEPTNDLDAETLELLESRMVDFAGTVLVVSHDRAFLDNLCTSTLVFEGGGRVQEFVGGYSDWRRVAERQSRDAASGVSSKTKSKGRTGPAAVTAKRKLTYKDQRELELLPGRIEELETALGDALEPLADPKFYRRDATGAAAVARRAKELEEEIEAVFVRWSELADAGS